VITEFPVFPELAELHTVFEICARENPAVLLSKHFQMHVLRLGDWMRNNQSGLDSLCVGLQRWMQFWGLGFKTEVKKMSTMLQDAPEVLSAYEEYRRFSADPVMREKARARKRFLDEQAIIMNDVREEGEAKGRAKEKIETARNFKRLGVPIATIAEATGLSVSEIERLKKKKKKTTLPGTPSRAAIVRLRIKAGRERSAMMVKSGERFVFVPLRMQERIVRSTVIK
jgi:predicted transposase/invertase (TIGR01784 family)